MMFCRNCGRQCMGGSFCPFCGTAHQQQPMMQPQPYQMPMAPYVPYPNEQETFKHTNAQGRPERGGFGWFLLGFILSLSLVTVILLSCWWRDFPNRCKSILTGAVISFILLVIGIFLFFWFGGLDWYIDRLYLMNS